MENVIYFLDEYKIIFNNSKLSNKEKILKFKNMYNDFLDANSIVVDSSEYPTMKIGVLQDEPLSEDKKEFLEHYMCPAIETVEKFLRLYSLKEQIAILNGVYDTMWKSEYVDPKWLDLIEALVFISKEKISKGGTLHDLF